MRKKKEFEYLIVIEQSNNGFGAFSPDLPGCVAVGDTRQEVRRLIKEAIKFHIAGMREDGLKIPQPRSRVELVKVAA
jgi:predicted RNase H-like HicB family nuclease